jgi:hypothetical protein
MAPKQTVWDGAVMRYEGDAFISYAHLDNVELVEGRKGWISNLQRALEIRVGQLLGKPTDIWWDPKLHGNDVFSETLMERLRRVAALVSVVSPRYVKSDWGQRELAEFVRAAETQGGLDIRDRSRIFKVMKTPVPLEEHPPVLRALLGYEFYKADPETGRIRELNEVFGPEAEREFWLRLDDMAHDLCALLEALDAGSQLASAADAGGAIFLAETTGDLRDARESIKRGLQQHGHAVRPARPLPWSMPDIEAALREELSGCRMSIHMVGRVYGVIPEGAVTSLQEIQHELVTTGLEAAALTRLVWIPPGTAADDPRQRAFIERLRMDPRGPRGTDLLETPLEGLKTQIAERLKPSAPTVPRATPDSPARRGQVYLIYDQRDADRILPWQEFFFSRGFEVLHPLFEGDEADVREYHEENLRICDGALVVHGAASEAWLRRKLREILKSAAARATKKAAAVAVALIEPRTAEKERFRTHDALVLEQWSGFSAEPLEAVLELLSPGL